MMFDAFDILKKLPDGGIVWMEGAKDLETAHARIKLFAGGKTPGRKPKTQSRSKTPAKPKASQVIAEIVADIARNLRH